MRVPYLYLKFIIPERHGILINEVLMLHNNIRSKIVLFFFGKYKTSAANLFHCYNVSTMSSLSFGKKNIAELRVTINNFKTIPQAHFFLNQAISYQ